jgi:hypothetical protein
VCATLIERVVAVLLLFSVVISPVRDLGEVRLPRVPRKFSGNNCLSGFKDHLGVEGGFKDSFGIEGGFKIDSVQRCGTSFDLFRGNRARYAISRMLRLQVMASHIRNNFSSEITSYQVDADSS